ncbi:MAG TPA: ABC transporter ATP-binding protein [Stellaceae bacterium]|nr:ABC transporter ATP-binding protein [Stellaceae bacterium]
MVSDRDQSRRRISGVQRLAASGAARFLMHYVWCRRASHLAILLAVLMAVGCSIGSQYALKNLVDVLASYGSSDLGLWGAVGTLLAFVAGDNLLWRLAGWIATTAFVAVGGDIRLDLFDHLFGHGTRYFADQFPGALAGRVTTAASATWSIENAVTWTTIPPAAAVISSVALLGVIDWRMTALLLVIVTAIALGIIRTAWNSQPLHQRYAGRAATVTGNLADVVINSGLVRSFGAAKRERARLSGDIRGEMSAQSDSLRALERLRLWHAIAVFAVTAGMLAWSAVLWRAGVITTGDVVLTTTLGLTVLHASRDLALALVDLVQHFAKLGEAVRVLGLPHEMEDAPNAKPLIGLGGSVSFVNVCFNYPDGESVLRDLSFHVPSGQKVGLVGRSGAGKSTILSLVQRLYDPERGHVLIDEQDVAEVTQDSLRQAIAVVHQDISLFHRSILENLRYGRPEASDKEIYRAAEAAHCTEFIQRLPDGFDTVVGQRGLKLSGGQRQRLAIARALLRDARIILLDEATSSLDSESEQAIQDALARLVQGRTVIAVAHRLSTLNSFDRIIVLDRGQIIEDGSAAELLRHQGVYRRMFMLQLAASKRP